MIVREGIWWQTSEFREVISSITGRTLRLNLSETRFLISPGFDASAVREVSRSCEAFWKDLGISSRPVAALRPYLTRFHTVADVESFGQALTALLEDGLRVKGNVTAGRITDLLILLWQAGCLAMPRNCTTFLGRLHEDRSCWGSDDSGLLNIVREFNRVSTGKNKSVQVRALSTVILSIDGVQEIGDLTPDVLDGVLLQIKLGPSIAAAIVSMMKVTYGPDRVPFTFDGYGPFGKRSERNDDRFMWVISEDPGLERWRALAEEWMSLTVRAVNDRRVALNMFLSYLIAHPEVAREPLVFLSTSTAIPGSIGTQFKTKNLLNQGVSFLDWILGSRCTAEDDHGHPYRLPGYRNPIDPNSIRPVSYAESVREAMPTRFVRRLRQILTEDDYAWPRNAFEPGTDDIRWFNSETGEWENIWCPVRTLAILMKLELPERTFQVRVCNSGEADEENYDVVSNSWFRNEHILAGQTPYGKSMGLPRRIKDFRVNSSFTGLYFNTNKTGDLGKAASDRGHVIPWQNEQVLQIADEMRRWQERYNPIHKPTAWLDIEEMRNRFSEDVLIERGAETFLFRDACSAHTDQPISATRLSVFWKKLCAELERRLADEGEVGPGGAPINLTNKRADGRTGGAVYNLHSLRVTMITAWAEAGVPVEILMKVAGHATAIMTIYYQKHTISHVTQVLNLASAEMMLNEQGNWQAWLKSKTFDALKPLVAHNDPAGPLALFEGATASVVRRDHGICPVGGGRCHEGGERVEGAGAKKYMPVPGGPQNCVRCRFFITGPCFLLGLNAYFDDVGFQYRNASRKYAEISRDFERLDHGRRRAATAGTPFPQYTELERISSILDQRTREVDEVALTWHATYNLIQQSLGILRSRSENEQDAETKNALILVGDEQDLEYVLQLDEAGDLEFELMDKICQTSVFFKSIDATVPNLRRMRRCPSSEHSAQLAA